MATEQIRDITNFKPLKGTAQLQKRERVADNKKHETEEMRAAKLRDRACRWPGCTLKLTLHAAHAEQHRGMGGNPVGDRTRRDQLITFCARHHGLFDHKDIDVQPMTPRGTDSACEYFTWNKKTQTFDFYARERIVHLSEERNPS